MADVVFVAALGAFFALCVAYVRWCGRIIGPADVSPTVAVDGSGVDDAQTDAAWVGATPTGATPTRAAPLIAAPIDVAPLGVTPTGDTPLRAALLGATSTESEAS